MQQQRKQALIKDLDALSRSLNNEHELNADTAHEGNWLNRAGKLGSQIAPLFK